MKRSGPIFSIPRKFRKKFSQNFSEFDKPDAYNVLKMDSEFLLNKNLGAFCKKYLQNSEIFSRPETKL